MKQTFKSKFSKNKRLTAIRDEKKLMKRGYSLSGARRYVSKALNIVPSTLYNWERELTGKVTEYSEDQLTFSVYNLVVLVFS